MAGDDAVSSEAQARASSHVRRLLTIFCALNVFAVGAFLYFLEWTSSSQLSVNRRFIPVTRAPLRACRC
jgi:hypothetical protein